DRRPACRPGGLRRGARPMSARLKVKARVYDSLIPRAIEVCGQAARAAIEDEIERLIDLLDSADEPDLELEIDEPEGWLDRQISGGNESLPSDPADMEPTL